MKEKDEFTGFSKKVGFRSFNLTEHSSLNQNSHYKQACKLRL